VDIFVHEAARDDIGRDNNAERRRISLSKLSKFQLITKVRGLTPANREAEFGLLSKPNDVVDATLLHALKIGAADFLVTQDRRLHDRARRHSAEIGRRVLYVADAVQLLRTTFEPIEAPIRFVEEVQTHSIPLTDTIFDSLREDYVGFDGWWTDKCVKQRRPCWIVEDDGVAGLLVRKDETGGRHRCHSKAQQDTQDLYVQGSPRKAGDQDWRATPEEGILVRPTQPVRSDLRHDVRGADIPYRSS